MTDRTRDFLKRMLDDPKLQEAFAKDPEGTMKKEGLPEEAAEAIRTGDLKRLAELAGAWSSVETPWPLLP